MVNDTQQIPAGYKQTDVGVIPEDWEVKPMVQMSFDISDGNYSSKYPKSSDFKSIGIPFIRANNIKRMTVMDEDMRFITKSQHAQLKKGHLKKNDILITTRGEIGQIAFVPDKYIDANINAQIVRINTTNSGVNSQFFGYYLTQDSIQNSFENSQSGSALKQLPVGKLIKLLVVIPSKKEQEKISEALLSIDSLIFKLDQHIQKKKNIKQGAMQELLTGKRRLPGFSGEWEEESLGDIFNLSAASSKSKYIKNGGKYLVMDMGSVSTDGKNISRKKVNSPNDLLKTGNLVMPKDDIGGGFIIGKVAYINADNKYVLGDHVYKLSCIKKGQNTLFYSFLINSFPVNSELKTKVSGSAQLGLGKKSAEEQLLKVPKDVSEQAAIAKVLSDIDGEIDNLENQKKKYQNLKQSMMQQLLTGKIRLI